MVFVHCTGVAKKVGMVVHVTNSPDQCECFQLSYAVVPLMFVHCMGSIGNLMDGSIVLYLGERGAQSHIAGMHFQDESDPGNKLGIDQHRCRHQSMFQLVKRLDMLQTTRTQCPSW